MSNWNSSRVAGVAGAVVAGTRSSDATALQKTRQPASQGIERRVDNLLKRMTLAELSAFVAEAREAGVPEDASPHVGTSWRGGIRRIAVSRPLPERSSG